MGTTPGAVRDAGRRKAHHGGRRGVRQGTSGRQPGPFLARGAGGESASPPPSATPRADIPARRKPLSTLPFVPTPAPSPPVRHTPPGDHNGHGATRPDDK